MPIPRFNDVSTWPEGELKSLAGQLQELDLLRHIGELELYGFTVVDASLTGAQAIAQRAFEASIDIVERRTGIRPDTEKGSTHTKSAAPVAWHFAHEDDAFPELMINPVATTLLNYLIGYRCMLSESALFMKGPGGSHDAQLSVAGDKLQLGLHSDYILRPEPFPAIPEECNLTWLLTDYTVDNGAIVFVPGSHHQRRRPTPADQAEDQIVAVEAPQGSLILINDATWHGSLPSKVPGLRVGLALRFCRPHVFRRERFDDLPHGYLDGKSERFIELMGGYEFHTQDHGPKDIEQFGRWPRPQTVYS